MKKILYVMMTLISTLAIAAAPAVSTYTQNEPNIVVSKDAPNFMIKLQSNPTTGYSWFLREYDANLVQPVKHEFIHGDKKLIGAPGYELWTFKIKPSGFIVPQQSSIRFSYARPWESTDSASQVVFHISTQGK